MGNEISSKAFEPPKSKTMFNILTFKSKIVLKHPSPNTNPLYFKNLNFLIFCHFLMIFTAMGVQSAK
jgi:hypothetical protein